VNFAENFKTLIFQFQPSIRYSHRLIVSVSVYASLNHLCAKNTTRNFLQLPEKEWSCSRFETSL